MVVCYGSCIWGLLRVFILKNDSQGKLSLEGSLKQGAQKIIAWGKEGKGTDWEAECSSRQQEKIVSVNRVDAGQLCQDALG